MNVSIFTIAFMKRAIAVKMAWKMAYDSAKKNANISIIPFFLSLNTIVFKALTTSFPTYKYTKKN